MTRRYLVLPRGINVGTRNRVSMGDLREGLADAGYTDVVTVLRSGNVIVTAGASSAAAVAADVGGLLRDRFGVDVPCVARTGDEVGSILERNPLAGTATDPSRYLVTFLSAVPDADAVAALLAEYSGPEVIVVDGAEAYVWSPDGISAMTLSYAHLEKRLGVTATARNWNTLGRVVARL